MKLASKNIPPSQDHSICVGAGDITLNGKLTHPENGEAGVVVFMPETLQDRHSNSGTIAKILNKNKLTTLLPDLSGASEDGRLDILKLADRLEQMARWTRENPGTSGLHLGYFAAGTGTEAALVAAARAPDLATAVVVRGGRPDEVVEFLPRIKAPVLLIAAGRDVGCVRSNQRALEKLNGKSVMNVVSGATQAFQEPGALEESAQLAALWFLQHLG